MANHHHTTCARVCCMGVRWGHRSQQTWQRNAIAYVAQHGFFATPQPCGGVYVYIPATYRTPGTTGPVRATVVRVYAHNNATLRAALGY